MRPVPSQVIDAVLVLRLTLLEDDELAGWIVGIEVEHLTAERLEGSDHQILL